MKYKLNIQATSRLINGDDQDARIDLSGYLNTLIEQSEKGEIALADFTDELFQIYLLSNKYLETSKFINN